MGLFDYVHFSMDCPVCGAEVDDFQTKDADCDGSTIEPDGLSRFYTSCGNCDTWIEFAKLQEGTTRVLSLKIDEVLSMGFVMTVAQTRKLAQKE